MQSSSVQPQKPHTARCDGITKNANMLCLQWYSLRRQRSSPSWKAHIRDMTDMHSPEVTACYDNAGLGFNLHTAKRIHHHLAMIPQKGLHYMQTCGGNDFDMATNTGTVQAQQRKEIRRSLNWAFRLETLLPPYARYKAVCKAYNPMSG